MFTCLLLVYSIFLYLAIVAYCCCILDFQKKAFGEEHSARASLCKSYWAIMNKIFMYARPCSIKWRVQFHFSSKISVKFSASSFCLSFRIVKIILNNPNPTWSLWVLPGKEVYFNVSILTLFVSIFIEYLYFVSLHFHCNLA